MVALTMFVQVFAVISPAEASNQCSSNDIVRCGFSTRAEAVQKCNANTGGFRTIVERFGVTCSTINGAGTVTLNSSALGNKLYSMGRTKYNKPGEYPIDIAGAGRFYFRPLSSWGSFNAKMLDMKAADGTPIRIMYDCGNIVIQQGYQPPAPAPEPPAKLKVAKINEPQGAVKAGDTIKYTIAFTNTGGTAAFFSVNDTLGPELEFVSANSNGWPQERNGQSFKWYNNTPPYYTFGNTDVFGSPGFITVSARVKAGTAPGTTVCNTAWLGHIVDGKPITSDKVSVCNKVEAQCPSGTIVQPDGSCVPPKPEEKTPLITQSKKAKNITQNIEDANGTVAQPGDVIEYSLTTNNFGTGDKKDTTLQDESLADVLEYADLDLNSLDGAVFDQDAQKLMWNKAITIKAGESVTKTFKVKIKSPLPQTPTPAGNPGSFDMILTNSYGNTVEIKLPATVVKTTEQATKALPNTGPGETLVVGGILVTVVGYFFARSRLMAKELDIIKVEYSSGN